MKVETRRTLAAHETWLVFNNAEQAALRRASAIAEEARERCRQVLGPEFEEDGIDTLLAELEHNHKDIIDGFVLSEFFAPAW